MYYLIILVAIILIYYLETHPVHAPPAPTPAPTENFTTDAVSAKDYVDVAAEMDLDPSIIDSHYQYVANVRQFSSGANYTSVADDNTSDLYTNYLGFVRPSYVEIRPGARQVPDIDDSVFKRNKRMVFVNDYGLN